MLRRRCHPLALLASAVTCALPLAASAQTTSLVRLGADGRLQYTANERGDVIPDFSGVGYANGDAPIPDVPVVRTVAPVAGDNTAHVQAAIDAVAALPLQADGFRGAIHFRAGTYELARQVRITAGGIVLRGDGTGPEGTHFRATGTKQYDLIQFSGAGGVKLDEATRRRVVDSYVPIGATRVQVEAGHAFRAGDWVVVHHQPTEAWIELLGMAKYGWKASGYQHQAERRVTRVEGDTVHLDAPIVEPVDPRYARAALVRIASSGRIEQCGIEHLRLSSRYASEMDEQHGWRGVVFTHVKNAWARHVVVQNFGYAAVSISSISCLWITVEHCQMLDPKSEPKGGRRYSFPINGQRCLVQHCLTRGGRHDFVSGARSPGPNVYHACLATEVVPNNDSGPHHRWNIGTLYDRIVSNMDLNVINRTSSGTGHGWTGAQIVLWNCTVRRALVQDPPGPFTNWAIGTVGEVGHVSRYSTEAPAVFESNGTPIADLPSLFEAQRRDRRARATRLALPGRLLLQEDFSAPATYTKEFQPAQPGWRARAWHQEWHRTPEGIASHWTSGHMPVLALEGQFQDFIVEFEFRFQKVPGQKAVCRVSALNPELDPRAYAVSAWANADSRERPWGVGLERDVWSPGGFTTIANQMVAFETDTWYAMRLEVVGDQALVSCNGVTLTGRHEKFALPKAILAIGTGHGPHEIRGLRVHEARPNPDWVPIARPAVPYFPIAQVPPREPLRPTVAEKLRNLPLLFDGRSLAGWVQAPAGSWVVRDGAMASTGAGRGVIYTERNYSHYRLVFQVRQTSGNHQPGVLVFGQRPPPGEFGLDALGGIQLAVPSGGHWDYRPGMNKAGVHFTRWVKIRFDERTWAQVEILVNAKTGTARMAVAQPPGTRAIATTSFHDPAAGRAGPIAWQMHHALLFDEYRDVRIEVDPKEDKLITIE